MLFNNKNITLAWCMVFKKLPAKVRYHFENGCTESRELKYLLS